MASVWTELKRRNVVKVGVSYAIVGWLLVEVASTVLPTFDAPRWALQTITFVIILGFPLALVLSWAFQFTPEGLKRDKKSSTGSRTTVAPVVTEQSVAVLPFVNMSPDPEQEYFSDGIAEELLNQLCNIRGLQVAGRTSSFAFKGQNEDLRAIGEKLNVASILEGSVRKAGERVRITAQLVKAADGFHLWSKTFDRELTDIFTIQEEIAKAVASALSIALGVGAGDLSIGGTRNFDAYDAYLAGLSLYRQITSDETMQAIECLEKAVALDPDYAQAWSVLAPAYENAATFFIADRTEELYKKGEDAALRAVEIAPEAVAPLVAAAQVQTRNRHWTQAEQSFKKALAIAPADYEANLYYGLFLQNVGRVRESESYCRQAARTEPLLTVPFVQIGFALEANGRSDSALKEFERCEGLIGNETLRQLWIAVHGMETSNSSLMQGALENAIAADTSGYTTSLVKAMLPLLDSPEAARAELQRLNEDETLDLPVHRAGIGVWASYFGDPQLALKTYRQMAQQGNLIVWTVWRALEKDMRRLPGFKDLLRDLGLVDYWRSTGNWGDFCRPLGDADFECE